MFLLINKPPHITSHDVIYQLRKITGIKTIGHAGTLDPFATGLLIIALERSSTKQLNLLIKLDKTYQATLQLGAISDTYDLTGKINYAIYPERSASKVKDPEIQRINHCATGSLTTNRQISAITQDKILSVLKSFIGQQLQTPPIYSAKKTNGQKSYTLARQGKKPKLIPQKINIYDIQLKKLRADSCELTAEISCSSGTYIRSLAHDIGQQLKCGAYLTQLKRTRIGPFKLSQAVNLNKLTLNNWQEYTFDQLPDLPIKSRVLIFGTFDLLHPGHKNFINQAANLGDELYIVVARDKNIINLKKTKPSDNENQRLKNLRQLGMTHHIILGNLDWSKRYRIINKIKPDIIALGYDQKINIVELQTKLKKYGLNPQIVKLKAYYPNKYKTSILKIK